FDHAKNAIKEIICTEIRRHSYLIKSDVLEPHEKQSIQKLLVCENITDQSIWFLSQMLHKHYNQKAIILIDEYDVPLAKAFDYNYYDQMVVLIRNILHQALKTNDSLQMAVLTGCLRISKESIFTGLNNPKIHSITSVRFDEYFGFTDQEVLELLKYYNLEEKYNLTKTWYNGYKFGNIDVYCPWDVINYVDDLMFEPNMNPQNYWVNTSGNNIVRRLLNKSDNTTRWELEQLIEGKSLEKTVLQELTYPEIDKSINHLWSVLFTTGYLTLEEKDYKNKQIDYSLPGSGLQTRTFRLKIPNEEVRSIFKDHIYSWFCDRIETDVERYTSFCQAFLDGDTQKIQDMFDKYLREMISIRDTNIKKSMKENFYHGVLLGILNFRTDWIVKSNQESGDGYSDIMLIHEDTRVGIVIEVKYSDNNNLELECQKALDQINKLNYTEALLEFEPVKIYKYAIACYKKRCKVIMTCEDIEDNYYY
ncbi:MAG: AAA family ATPase, partial [Oscillospiraceae bacterium]|nr:AAA family ATPase [Oscillospiraceae bacterium]